MSFPARSFSVAVLSLSSLLMGCNETSASGAPAPEVAHAYTWIQTNGEGASTDYSLAMVYIFVLEDMTRADEVMQIVVRAPYDDFDFVIHDLSEGQSVNHLAADGSYFYSYFHHDSERPHRWALDDYEVTVITHAGTQSKATFSLSIPEGWRENGHTFLYGPQYTGDKTDGLPGLDISEAETIHLTADHLEVNLKANDHRTSGVRVFLYKENGEDDYELVARTQRFTTEHMEMDGTATQLVVSLNDEDQFTHSEPDTPLSEITHYAVAGYAPTLLLPNHEEESTVMLSWNGRLPIDQ